MKHACDEVDNAKLTILLGRLVPEFQQTKIDEAAE
jgi:hypothetical protein